MRYTSIDNISQGAYLAKPLYDMSGRKLVDINRPLSSFIIQKLREYGVAGLYVIDERYEDIFVEELIKESTKIDAVNALKRLDVDAAMRISKRLVDELEGAANLLYEVKDLRTYTDYTYRHSVNVAMLSTIVGIGMGMRRDKLSELALTALLHDIGKSKISKDILEKPGKLTEAEYEEIKKHPAYAYEMLKDNVNISAVVKTGILLHHENMDGTGYPLGLKERDIYEFARIIHVLDVYDALINKRVYKEAYTPLEASEYLMANCGTMFDTQIVKTFLTYVAIYPKATEVVLSDGREGVVFDNNMDYVLRPIVQISTGEIIDLTKTLNLTIVG